MSEAHNPLTGKLEDVAMLDDHFGRHNYGVKFSDGNIYPSEGIRFPLDEDKVEIARSIYEDLLDDEHRLQCLEAAGIDNCEAYAYGMEQYHEEKADDE